MATYRLEKKQNPTEFEKAYGIDSIADIKLKLFDLEKSTWIAEKDLSVKNISLTVTKDKIIFFDKDKQNYYLKYIAYHEN